MGFNSETNAVPFAAVSGGALDSGFLVGKSSRMLFDRRHRHLPPYPVQFRGPHRCPNRQGT